VIGLWRCIAEFIGTVLLVFAGSGAVGINAVSGDGVTSLGIGLSFGLAAMATISMPSSTFQLLISTRQLPLPSRFPATFRGRWFQGSLVPGYVLAQLAGACAASAVHLLLFGGVAGLGATVPSGSFVQALGLKLVLTLFLMFVISLVATDVRAVGQATAIAYRCLRCARCYLCRSRGWCVHASCPFLRTGAC
jgi:aquaporin Z